MNETYRRELKQSKAQSAQDQKHIQSLEKQIEEQRAQLQANIEEMKTYQFRKMLEYWRELHKMNFKYIPQKDDPVDGKLADYINKSDSEQKMKCLFVREEKEGHYSYFTKLVIMKVKNNNLTIRVGGGFMSIDEFIE